MVLRYCGQLLSIVLLIKYWAMSNTIKIYISFLLLCVIFVGGSILYLSNVAKNADTPVARLYPASNVGAGGVTIDNLVLAKNIVENKVFSRSLTAPFEPDVWRTPGYPIFVAFFYALFNSFYPVVVAQIFTLFLTVILIFKMSKKLLGQRWALALSILYIILPDTILSASALFNENIFMLLFMSSIYVFFFKEFKNIYIKWALTGFLLALTVYVRPASLYLLIFFIPAIFIFYLRRNEINAKHFFAALFMIIAFLGTLLPWCIRNQREVGVFSFASTGPYVLFRQNAAQFYASLNGIDNVAARKALLQMAGIPEGTVGGLIPQDLKYSEAMKKTAISVILSNPFKYAVFHLSSFIPFFTSSGANEYSRFVHDMLPNYDPGYEPSLIQALNPFSWSVLIVVIKNHGWTLVENSFWALVALLAFLSVRYSKDAKLMRVFIVIVFYFAIVTGPIAHARYRIPVEPLLLIAAFSSTSYFYLRYKNKGLQSA